MKSFTEFKRNVKLGTELRIENLLYPEISRDTVVTKLKSTGFAARLERPDGSVVDSWIYWPKAAETRIEGNTLYVNGEHYINGSLENVPSFEITIKE